MLAYVLSIPSFFLAFIMKGCWTLPTAFSASIETMRRLPSLTITLIDLRILNHLYNWNKTNLDWCRNFLVYSWIWFPFGWEFLSVFTRNSVCSGHVLLCLHPVCSVARTEAVYWHPSLSIFGIVWRTWMLVVQQRSGSVQQQLSLAWVSPCWEALLLPQHTASWGTPYIVLIFLI